MIVELRIGTAAMIADLADVQKLKSIGTIETSRRRLKMSVERGGPEVSGAR
jgi:hypothetical protein